MMNNYIDFDNILHQREVPPMRSNLENRIIENAIKSFGNKGRKKPLLSVIFDNLMLPKPVVSLVIIMVIGVFLGFYSVDIDALSQNGMDEYFLEYSELEYGEFL